MDQVLFDIILESFRALGVAVVFFYFASIGRNTELSRHSGWRYILAGFGLLIFGAILDLSDNFPQLDTFVILGKTQAEAFFEKIVGYTGGFLCIAFGFWKWIPSVLLMERTRQELKLSHEQLEIALANAKVLRGLLPICATCKKVRDDKGYWNQIESYLKVRTEAEFTHGICPECSAKLQAEMDSCVPK